MRYNEKKAMKEGWILAIVTYPYPGEGQVPHYQIQRYDDDPKDRFSGDEEAFSFVKHCSLYAAKKKDRKRFKQALKLHETRV